MFTLGYLIHKNVLMTKVILKSENKCIKIKLFYLYFQKNEDKIVRTWN